MKLFLSLSIPLFITVGLAEFSYQLKDIHCLEPNRQCKCQVNVNVLSFLFLACYEETLLSRQCAGLWKEYNQKTAIVR